MVLRGDNIIRQAGLGTNTYLYLYLNTPQNMYLYLYLLCSQMYLTTLLCTQNCLYGDPWGFHVSK